MQQTVQANNSIKNCKMQKVPILQDYTAIPPVMLCTSLNAKKSNYCNYLFTKRERNYKRKLIYRHIIKEYKERDYCKHVGHHFPPPDQMENLNDLIGKLKNAQKKFTFEFCKALRKPLALQKSCIIVIMITNIKIII